MMLKHIRLVIFSAIILVACFADRYSFAQVSESNPEELDPSGSWRLVSPMAHKREQFGAVRLRDGKVLVFGSHRVAGKPITTAELYDPANDRWTETGSLNSYRSGIFKSVAMLPDGKVLLAGEYTGIEKAGVEIYDPATGTWAPTGAMVQGRGGHTTVLLPNGKVLVAGGIDWDTELAIGSAEIYDPRTGTWTTTNPMAEARFTHRAALLADGRVLVTGGLTGGQANPSALTSAEIYDPESETWERTASMSVARRNHEALLLGDGRVLVAGGSESRVAELYDPVLKVWKETGSMGESRLSFTATVLDNGHVLVVGGSVPNTVWSRSGAEIFDPSDERWFPIGNMSLPRRHHRAVKFPDGDVMIMGGSGPVFHDSVEMFSYNKIFNPN